MPNIKEAILFVTDAKQCSRSSFSQRGGATLNLFSCFQTWTLENIWTLRSGYSPDTVYVECSRRLSSHTHWQQQENVRSIQPRGESYFSACPEAALLSGKLYPFSLLSSQVTLKFGFQVELCRVDVELWPWGMDRGQASKRLEISTSSDPLPSHKFNQGHKRVQQKDKIQMQVKHQNKLNNNNQECEGKSHPSNGHPWTVQAQQWGEESVGGYSYKHQMAKDQAQANADSQQPEAEFKLVGRCELSDLTRVSFSQSNFRPQPLFPSPPPAQPANCRQEDLWSRGALSLGAVTQLRVTLAFGGSASALGFKALSVWGQPARCCPPQEVERIKTVHEANERRLPQPGFFTSSVRPTSEPQQAATSLRYIWILRLSFKSAL